MFQVVVKSVRSLICIAIRSFFRQRNLALEQGVHTLFSDAACVLDKLYHEAACVTHIMMAYIGLYGVADATYVWYLTSKSPFPLIAAKSFSDADL